MKRRSFLFRAAALAAAPASRGTPAANGGNTWKIKNSQVEREIRFDRSAGLMTVGWRHKVTGTEFLRLKGRSRIQEFGFAADDAQISGRAAAVEILDSAFVDSPLVGAAGSRELRVRMRVKQKPLEVTAHYAVHGEHPAIRKWLSIRNTGNAPITLSQMCFESAPIAPGPANRLEACGGYGSSPRELFSTGRVSDVAMIVRNGITREGYAVMNEAPGYLKRTELNQGFQTQVQVMYDTDLFPFEFSLKPGGVFVTAKSSIAMFADGKGYADSRWVIPAYVADVLTVRGRSFRAPLHYNTWIPFHRNVSQNLCTELIDRAARMGIEIFTIDDGWDVAYGSNEVNRAVFPDGLEAIRARLKEHGMGLGLWVPLATVAPETKDARQHPEWFCRDRNGKVKSTRTASGEQVVMCLATGYRDLAAQRLIALIEMHQPKYLKVDLTTVFNTYGESPGCFAQGHDHGNWAESLELIYEGLQYVAAKVRKAHPGTLLDYTFELWGEKHLIDYALLQSAELDWLSNVSDSDAESAGPRQCRTLLYPRAISIPPDAMMIGNMCAENGSMEEHFATAIASAPLLLGDLTKLKPEQIEWYARKIEWFKDLRERVPLAAFFPLGSWRLPSVGAWDGYARLSREGEGIIAIFANDSGIRAARIQIPSFPDGEYSIRPVDRDGRGWHIAGSKIRTGWDVPIPSGSRVRLLELTRAKSA